MHKLICIVGKSGTGKTSVVNHLEKYYELNNIKSYTTRPPRYKGEEGHIFITDEDYEKFKNSSQIVAYTYFNGYHYFATLDQLLLNDLYVIDFAGIKYLKNLDLSKDIELEVVYLTCPWWVCAKRMFERGDSILAIIKRLINDYKEFSKSDIAKYSNVILDAGTTPIEKLAWDIYKVR